MGKHLNFYSFFLCLMSLSLFFLTKFLGVFRYIRIGIHPLFLVLILSMAAFILGVFGSFRVREWKSGLLCVVSLIISFCLSVLLLSIIFIGRLLS